MEFKECTAQDRKCDTSKGRTDKVRDRLALVELKV